MLECVQSTSRVPSECVNRTKFWIFCQNKRDKVFKSGLSKFCGSQLLKKLLSPLLNILSQIIMSEMLR